MRVLELTGELLFHGGQEFSDRLKIILKAEGNKIIVKQLISIIVPVYNVEKYIKRCLDSILAQTYTNIEIILVDDGSTDSSGRICDDYAGKDNRITVIHKENGGVASARNAGLDITKGEYIGFVDPDDYIDQDMYEYLEEVLNRTDSDISQCGAVVHSQGRVIEPKQPDYYEIADSKTAISALFEGKFVQGSNWSKLFRSELFKKVRYRNYMMSEDWMLNFEMFSQIRKMVITNVPKYHYCRHPNSLTTAPFNEGNMDQIRVFEEIFRRVKDMDPELVKQVRKFRCKAYMNVLDSIYTSCLRTEIENDIVCFLREEKRIVLRKGNFKVKRQLAFFVFLMNKDIYKWIVRWYFGRKQIYT